MSSLEAILLLSQVAGCLPLEGLLRVSIIGFKEEGFRVVVRLQACNSKYSDVIGISSCDL
jgi:hypothetical protein